MMWFHGYIQGKTFWLYLAFALLSLTNLVLFLSVAVLLCDRPDEGFTWSQSDKVQEIIPGSPAAIAGLQTGDVIIERDGLSPLTGSYLYRDKKPGDTVIYSVLRDGLRHTIPVTLRAPSSMLIFRRLEPLLIAVFFWVIGIVTAYMKPTSPESLLFYLYSQAGAGVLTAGTLSAFNVAWAARLFNVLLCLLASLLLHFHLTFPVCQFASSRKLIVSCSYSTSSILMLPYFLVNPLLLKTLSWYSLWRASTRVTFSLHVFFSIGLLSYSYFTTSIPQVRRQVRVIAAGTTGALAPLVLLSVLPGALMGRPLVDYEFTFLILPLIPLAYVIAIYRYNLLNIDRLINRGMVYLTLGAFRAGFYLLLVAGMAALFTATLPTYILLATLVVVCTTVPVVPIQQRIRGWVDRLFYGSWYDYRSVVSNISDALAETYDEKTLTHQLVHRTVEAMGIEGAALFLVDDSGRLGLRGYRDFARADEQASLPPSGPLAQLLCRNGRPTDVSNLDPLLNEESLSDAERAWLEAGYARIWIPIVFKEELRGVLVLGNKKVDSFFDKEDLLILETLSHQAALAAENIRLLEALRQRQEELEILHHRLLLGREEERKRISRDLHDRVLQRFFALNADIKAMLRVVDSPQETSHLMSMRRKVRELVAETRHLCTELRPSGIGISGLADTIRSYTEQWAACRENTYVVGGFSGPFSPDVQPDQTITLDLVEDRKRLPEEMAVALFRVYQEALANIERHAVARNIWVKETLTDEKIELCVRDDGRGFFVPNRVGSLVQHSHFGLLGIQEQMTAIGGEASITSQRGQGTELRVWVPLSERGQVQ
jgi:signal transduction histidine kinase